MFGSFFILERLDLHDIENSMGHKMDYRPVWSRVILDQDTLDITKA